MLKPNSGLRFAKINRARAAMGRADQYLRTHPGASASGLVRDLKQTVEELITEIGMLEATPGDR